MKGLHASARMDSLDDEYDAQQLVNVLMRRQRTAIPSDCCGKHARNSMKARDELAVW